MSLRSRTGRESRSVEGVTLSQDTLVFLKTNMRKSFFCASDDSVDELSVIDALKYFKADTTEEKVERIEHHHDHVLKAIDKFKQLRGQEQVEHDTQAQQAGSAMGAQVGMAANLLNLFLPEIQDQTIYQQVVQLRILAERGVITIIAKRLQRMQKEMQRGKLHRDDALSQIINMAKKYNAYYLSAEDLKHETESEAQIILSESFK